MSFQLMSIAEFLLASYFITSVDDALHAHCSLSCDKPGYACHQFVNYVQLRSKISLWKASLEYVASRALDTIKQKCFASIGCS